MFALGQVVFSKCGRDKGRAFIVTAEEGDYVYLVDGALRPLVRPKKKKTKHVQVSYQIDTDIAEKLKEKAYLNDAVFRKALRAYDKDYRSDGDSQHDDWAAKTADCEREVSACQKAML